MVVLLKEHPDERQLNYLKNWLASMNIEARETQGEHQTILGLVGDTSRIDMDLIRALEIVEDVRRIQEPYKSANRKFHPLDTVVSAGGAQIGGGHFAIIAGPCSVESEAQIVEVARRVKAAGATLLRGGAFKPRTSPYAFQGLHAEGLRAAIHRQEGNRPAHRDRDHGRGAHLRSSRTWTSSRSARGTCKTSSCSRSSASLKKPILLKRGLANTIQELLMSAEYIMSGGNEQVILCERGIRTFETSTRNTLDISAVPVLKSLTHLPVIVDPSHASGTSRLVKPLSMASVAAGADGLIIEVHNDPPHALCDGAQSLTPEAFDDVARCVFNLRTALKAG